MFKKKGDEINFLNKKGQLRPRSGEEELREHRRELGRRQAESERRIKQVGITQEIPFFSWFFRKLGFLLSKLAKGIWIIIFFFLFVTFLVFLYNYYYVAGQGAVLAKHAATGVAETFSIPVVGPLVATFQKIYLGSELVTNYKFESDVEKNKDNQDLGLKISELKQEGGDVFSNSPIFVRGTIKAQSFDRPIIADVECSLEDYDGRVKLNLPVSEGEEKIKIYGDVPQTYNVGCYFEDGIDVSEETERIATEKAPSIIAKNAKLSVIYDFVTKASHNTYFLRRELSNSFLARGEDPFKYYGIIDPQLKSDRTVRSKTTVGPINLGIGTYDSQPLSENTPYFLGVSLTNNIAFNGNLKKLKRLEIMLPPNMAVPGETEFEGEGTCDFYYTGSLDENGFKIYDLKTEKLDEVNKRCNLDDLKNRKITLDNCIKQLKSSFDYLCQFKIVEPIYGDSVYVDFIRAEADYVYETSRKTTINIIASPQSIA